MINNEEYAAAWKDRDNRKVMAKAAARFCGLLSKDEVRTDKMTALLHALEKFDPVKSKFKTYLSNWVRWECLKAIKEKRAYFKRHEPLPYEPSPKEIFYSLTSLEEYCGHLNDEEKSLVEARFVRDETYLEISKKYNITQEAIRLKLKKITEKLKEKYGDFDCIRC